MGMDAVNGYLTKKAQSFWPGSVIGVTGGRYVLDRPNKPKVDLGKDEKEAHLAITSLVNAKRQREKDVLPEVEL